MKISLKNLALALWDQGPPARAFRNFVITGCAWGLFSENSHISFSTGKPKIFYPRRSSAQKAARSLESKNGGTYSVYKCAFCDGYHVGKSRSRQEARKRFNFNTNSNNP